VTLPEAQPRGTDEEPPVPRRRNRRAAALVLVVAAALTGLVTALLSADGQPGKPRTDANERVLCERTPAPHTVQVLLAEPGGKPRDRGHDRDLAEKAVAEADTFLAASGPGHRIRWACEAGRLSMRSIATPEVREEGLVPFADIVAAVQSVGHDRADRLYAIFYPRGEGYEAVGEATGGGDRSQGPQYALIAEWTGYWTLHELGHTLGAVPFDAPHQYKSGHCLEQNDVMCRRLEDLDDPEFPALLELNCPDAPEWLFDCNNDDYYLHDGDWWDVADSPYLYLAPERRPSPAPRRTNTFVGPRAA
jgi:hypothetical protein